MIEQHSGNGANQDLSLSLTSPTVTTLATVAKEDYPLTIIRAKNEQSVELLAKRIVDGINNYLDAVDLRNTMNTNQVLLAAQFIIEEHPHLPVKALDLFFRDAAKGKFGPHYNKMDIPTLMQWLQKFHNDYDMMIEEEAYRAHQSTKGDKTNLMALIEEHIGEELVAMPDSVAKAAGLKVSNPDKEKIERIRMKVIDANKHLITTLGAEEAMKQMNALIEEELLTNGIFITD